MNYGEMASPAKEPGFQFEDPDISEAERVKSLESIESTSSTEDGTEQAGTKKIETITSSWSK